MTVKSPEARSNRAGSRVVQRPKSVVDPAVAICNRSRRPNLAFLWAILLALLCFQLGCVGVTGAANSGGNNNSTATFSLSGKLSPSAGGAGATLKLAGASAASTVSDASGNFIFSGLVDGTYTVTPSNAGYTFSPATMSATISGANVSGMGAMAAPVPSMYSISGTAGAAAVTLFLTGTASATVTADASGNYNFTALPNGAYSVTPSKAGYTFSPTSQSVTVSGGNVNVPSFTATAIPSTFTASGTIAPAASGNSATVTLGGAASATTTANSSGAFSFSGLANGTYTVTPSKTGYTFSPANQSVTVSGGNVNVPSFTATAIPSTFTASGTIAPAASGNGATVTLSGAASATTTANSSGAFSFSGLANGIYMVTPSKTGYTFSPANQSVTVSGGNVNVPNFTATAIPSTFTASGTIAPAASGNGATVTLSGAASATTTANSSGAFSFSGLANGTYTVTPGKAGYTFSPANQSVTVSGGNVNVPSFTATAIPSTFTASGTIAPAASGNSATVTLSGAASATTTANSSGAFSFSGLANGTYTVTPSKTGYTFSPANQSVTVSGGNITVPSFTATALTYSISGTVMPSSIGSGATINLSGAATASTTADSSGNFSFTGLANGTYTLTPGKAGATFSPASQIANVNSSNISGIKFNAVFSISGNTGTGAGVTVNLSGPSSASTTTDGSGNYSFSALANGSTYVISPTNSAYVFTPSNQSVTLNGANVTGVNFTASAAPSGFSIPGKITLSSKGLGAGSTLTLANASSGVVVASTTADSSGNFTLTGIANGSYVLTPTSSAAAFTPVSRNITISGANSAAANFTAAGLIFYDDFTGSSLGSEWTVISRHGEYAQGETECNIPQMVSVANSILTIKTVAQATTCGDFNTDGTVRHAPASWPYATGAIQWTNLNFTYGTVEIRAQFPAKSTQVWPATWMLGTNCQLTNIYTADTGYSSCPNFGASGYRELDLTECFGSTWCQFNAYNPGDACQSSYSVDNNYHIFTTVWTASSVTQAVDGVTVSTCNLSMNQPLFLIIQTQTGGVGGTPANLPTTLNVDYVKVTQP